MINLNPEEYMERFNPAEHAEVLETLNRSLSDLVELFEGLEHLDEEVEDEKHFKIVKGMVILAKPKLELLRDIVAAAEDSFTMNCPAYTKNYQCPALIKKDEKANE